MMLSDVVTLSDVFNCFQYFSAVDRLLEYICFFMFFHVVSTFSKRSPPPKKNDRKVICTTDDKLQRNSDPEGGQYSVCGSLCKTLGRWLAGNYLRALSLSFKIDMLFLSFSKIVFEYLHDLIRFFAPLTMHPFLVR